MAIATYLVHFSGANMIEHPGPAYAAAAAWWFGLNMTAAIRALVPWARAFKTKSSVLTAARAVLLVTPEIFS